MGYSSGVFAFITYLMSRLVPSSVALHTPKANKTRWLIPILLTLTIHLLLLWALSGFVWPIASTAHTLNTPTPTTSAQPNNNLPTPQQRDHHPTLSTPAATAPHSHSHSTSKPTVKPTHHAIKNNHIDPTDPQPTHVTIPASPSTVSKGNANQNTVSSATANQGVNNQSGNPPQATPTPSLTAKGNGSEPSDAAQSAKQAYQQQQADYDAVHQQLSQQIAKVKARNDRLIKQAQQPLPPQHQPYSPQDHLGIRTIGLNAQATRQLVTANQPTQVDNQITYTTV